MENWETIRTGHHVDFKRRENSESKTYSSSLKVQDFVYSEDGLLGYAEGQEFTAWAAELPAGSSAARKVAYIRGLLPRNPA